MNRTYAWPDPYRLWRRIATVFLIACVALAASAGACKIIDAREWARSAAASRADLERDAGPPSSRSRSVVILLRDVTESIATLRREASGSGPSSDQARVALQIIASDAAK